MKMSDNINALTFTVQLLLGDMDADLRGKDRLHHERQPFCCLCEWPQGTSVQCSLPAFTIRK
jgi:hypothetical protein